MDTITLVYSGSQAPVSDQGPRHAVGRAGVSGKTEGLPKCSQLLFAGGLACYTQEEIGEAVGLPQRTIADDVPVLAETDSCPKPLKLLATYTDAEWKPPLYAE